MCHTTNAVDMKAMMVNNSTGDVRCTANYQCKHQCKHSYLTCKKQCKKRIYLQVCGSGLGFLNHAAGLTVHHGQMLLSLLLHTLHLSL